MSNRTELINQLLLRCPSGAYLDFCVIAGAIERGYGRDDVLVMPAVNRWPKTAAWLAERL